MSDAYTPTFSFAGYQANSPSSPLPAQQVDDQFALISAAIATLSAYLQQVRRADGQLQNESVTLDAFDPDLLALFESVQAVTVTDLSPTALASETEAGQGESNAKLMTPLRVKNAIDARRPYASQVEAAAGTVAAKVMTPALTTFHFLGRFSTAFVSVTFPTINPGAYYDVDTAISGATVGQPVLVAMPSAGPPVGLTVSAWVVAVNTVRLRFYNGTGSPVSPSAGQYKLSVVKI